MRTFAIVLAAVVVGGFVLWLALSQPSRTVPDSAPKPVARTPLSSLQEDGKHPSATPEGTESRGTEGRTALTGQGTEAETNEAGRTPPILGHVLTETGEPIAGAEVLLVAEGDSEGPVGTAFSDSEGSFQIPNLPTGGRWVLLGHADGYARGGMSGLTPEAFKNPIVLTLIEEATITGRVLENLTGDPVPEAMVEADPDKSSSALQKIWARVRPNVAKVGENSHYIVRGLPGDSSWDLTCVSPAHIPEEKESIPAGSVSIDFILDRGASIRGEVLLADSEEPVQGAMVTLWSSEGDIALNKQAVTDASGEFLLIGLPFGSYRVRAEKGDLSSHPRPDQGSEVSVSPDRKTGAATLFLKHWPLGVLSGTVRDIENSGVAQAVVEVMDLEGRNVRHSARTNSAGGYRIEGIYGGDYRVGARAEGLYTDERGLRLLDGEKRDEFDFLMIPGFTISGRVTLSDEETGVRDAIVERSRRRGESVPPAETDSEGAYTLGPVPIGDHILTVTPPDGYFAREEARQVAITDSDVTGINFIVDQGGTIVGEVVSATGPVEGARVSLATALETPEAISTYQGEVRTDVAGGFELIGVPEGLVYSVVVRHRAYADHVSDIETMRKAETVEHPTIRLESPGGLIRGRACMGNGSIPPPFRVRAQTSGVEQRYRVEGRWQPGPTDYETSLNNSGRFRFPGLAAGAWEVSILAPRSFQAEPQVVDVPPNGEVYVEFVLGASSEGTSIISGRVIYADGQPAAGFMVQAAAFRDRDFQHTRASEQGDFVIRGLTEGRQYRISTSAPDSSFWRRSGGPSVEATAPAEGLELVIEMPGTITGRVTDANGYPLQNYEVRVRTERRFGFGGSGETQIMSGLYVVRELSPGQYQVQGFAPELGAAESDWVDVQPGHVTEGVDLVFDAGATLKGTVLEQDNDEPVPGARVFTRAVFWRGDISSDYVERSTYTNSEGKFILEHLPRGRIWLAIDHGLYAAHFEREIEIPEDGDPEELTVHLTLGGRVEGQVLDQAGVGVPGQQVEIHRRHRHYSAVSDAGGSFSLGHLPEGEYSVEWRTVRQRVEVQTGETATVVLQEPPPEEESGQE